MAGGPLAFFGFVSPVGLSHLHKRVSCVSVWVHRTIWPLHIPVGVESGNRKAGTPQSPELEGVRL